jgi:hypothetical protein
MMRWHIWVVLIAGSTVSAFRAVRPPASHHADCRRDLAHAAGAAGSLWRSPLAIIARAILAKLVLERERHTDANRSQ